MTQHPCDPEQTLERARRVLKIEADAILHAHEMLDESFTQLVQLILNCEGKVVISGVGKSGIVGAKMAATLSSTGTPAVSLDPLNALHGDLGIVSRGDVILALSNSGETEELLNVVDASHTLDAKIVALTGNVNSTLAQSADIVLLVDVRHEACPLGLAPTASTATVMAVGDALAMALLEQRRFTSKDFAVFHPGGSLGRRLKLRVKDIMRTGDDVPSIPISANLAHAMEEMTNTDNLGTTFVVNDSNQLVGVITDGDLRRVLMRAETGADIRHFPVSDLMSSNPKVIDTDAIASEALRVMELHSITSLAIIDGDNRPVGIVLLHDILGRGKFTI